MFFIKNKIDSNLKEYISNKSYKRYRVLIKCKNFTKEISKKVSSYKGELIYILEYSSIVCAYLDSRSINLLSEYPEVKYITFDDYLFLCGMSVGTANKYYKNNKFDVSGAGVGIGIVDSGVYPHPDLLNPSSNISEFHDLINKCTYPYDDNGHGTSICGILSSSGISSNGMYKGIAPHANLYCYKAFDKCGKGFASTILYSIENLIKDASSKNIRLLCLPFELLNHNNFIINAFKDTFTVAISQGVIPIVPSGSNENINSSIMGIAILDNCITVGGVDTNSYTSSYCYSSCGPFKNNSKPNLSASCVNITSLNTDTSYISEKEGLKLYPKKLEVSYKAFTGTSLSTAYICGLCALILEKQPNLNFKDLLSILKLSCEIGDLDKQKSGEGIINISKLFN